MIAPFPPVPPIPTAIQLPEKKDLVTEYIGVGLQLYQYRRQTDGSLAWVSTGVDAKLFTLTGELIGAHTTGPQWTFGTNTLKGAKLSESNATNPTSIPWLLLRITNPSPDGNQISYVQRVYTAAGLPPDASAKVSEGETYGAPYTAIYLFWGVVPKGGGL